jgi:hypothetical protein
VPQKIATFWGISKDVPQKDGYFEALLHMPQKMAFGALFDVPQNFICIYYIKLTGSQTCVVRICSILLKFVSFFSKFCSSQSKLFFRVV